MRRVMRIINGALAQHRSGEHPLSVDNCKTLKVVAYSTYPAFRY